MAGKIIEYKEPMFSKKTPVTVRDIKQHILQSCQDTQQMEAINLFVTGDEEELSNDTEIQSIVYPDPTNKELFFLIDSKINEIEYDLTELKEKIIAAVTALDHVMVGGEPKVEIAIKHINYAINYLFMLLRKYETDDPKHKNHFSRKIDETCIWSNLFDISNHTRLYLAKAADSATPNFSFIGESIDMDTSTVWCPFSKAPCCVLALIIKHTVYKESLLKLPEINNIIHSDNSLMDRRFLDYARASSQKNALTDKLFDRNSSFSDILQPMQDRYSSVPTGLNDIDEMEAILTQQEEEIQRMNPPTDDSTNDTGTEIGVANHI